MRLRKLRLKPFKTALLRKKEESVVLETCPMIGVTDDWKLHAHQIIGAEKERKIEVNLLPRH